MTKTPKKATEIFTGGDDSLSAADPYPNLSPAQEAALDRIPDDGVTRPGGSPPGGNSPSKLEVALEAIKDIPVSPGVSSAPTNPPPTVGRIVHFYANSEDKPQAAIIHDVSDMFENTVHLTVFSGSGIRVISDVPYVDDLTQDGPAWRWPGFGYTSPPQLANIGIFPGKKVFGESR